MAEMNEREKKIILKIVYYGPAMGGKTTNLMRLHDLLDPAGRSDLMTFETRGDRTIFFDLLPLMARSKGGFRVEIKLFTVPGQVAHDATRKAVLSRADSVVFVADSQKNQAMSNAQSFHDLEENAGRVGLDFDHLPLVIQFNKRDLKETLSEEEILGRWKPTGLPLTFASALHGRGVAETFQIALKRTYRRIDELYGLLERYAVAEEEFLQVVRNVHAGHSGRKVAA
jgi:signal recognition particle receptor subunit beta